MTGIFDTHTHLNDPAFSEDRDRLLRALPERGVAALTEIGYDLPSSASAVALAEETAAYAEGENAVLPEVYAAIGFHPDHIQELTEETEGALRGLAASKKTVAIGEIGLDYYYMDRRTEAEKAEALLAKERLRELHAELWKRREGAVFPEAIPDGAAIALPEKTEPAGTLEPASLLSLQPEGAELDRIGISKKEYRAIRRLAETVDFRYDAEPAIQKEGFRRMLSLAAELSLPLVIHSRDAARDTFELVKNSGAYRNGGIVHCYSYSWELAEEYAKLGLCIGIGGVLTFPNARRLRETAEKLPLEYLVLETDSPYMAPVPYRGQRNDPGLLPEVVRVLSELCRLPEEEIVRRTTENARRVYRV